MKDIPTAPCVLAQTRPMGLHAPIRPGVDWGSGCFSAVRPGSPMRLSVFRTQRPTSRPRCKKTSRMVLVSAAHVASRRRRRRETVLGTSQTKVYKQSEWCGLRQQLCSSSRLVPWCFLKWLRRRPKRSTSGWNWGSEGHRVRQQVANSLHFRSNPRDPHTFSEGTWALQAHTNMSPITVSEKVLGSLGDSGIINSHSWDILFILGGLSIQPT